MDKKYVGILKRMLDVCDNYNYALSKAVSKEPLVFMSMCPIQDECAYFGITKDKGKFVYSLAGSYFGGQDFISKRPPTLEEVSNVLSELKINDVNEVMELFKKSVKGPIGRSLAEKEEGRIESILRE